MLQIEISLMFIDIIKKIMISMADIWLKLKTIT